MAHGRGVAGGLYWTQCSCGVKYLELSHRTGWMRLFLDRRLFFCRACRHRMLIPVPALRRH